MVHGHVLRWIRFQEVRLAIDGEDKTFDAEVQPAAKRLIIVLVFGFGHRKFLNVDFNLDIERPKASWSTNRAVTTGIYISLVTRGRSVTRCDIYENFVCRRENHK